MSHCVSAGNPTRVLLQEPPVLLASELFLWLLQIFVSQRTTLSLFHCLQRAGPLSLEGATCRQHAAAPCRCVEMLLDSRGRHRCVGSSHPGGAKGGGPSVPAAPAPSVFFLDTVVFCSHLPPLPSRRPTAFTGGLGMIGVPLSATLNSHAELVGGMLALPRSL